MTSVCRTWKHRDALHWRGLCSSQMFAVDGVDNCRICVTPERETGPCTAFCSPPLMTYRYLVLDLRKVLTEPTPVYPVETYSTSSYPGYNNLRVYDKYSTAEEIGTTCSLEATGWSGGVNTTCAWQFQRLYRRWYQRITTFPGPVQTMAVTDIEYTSLTPPANPYTGCAFGSRNQCTSTDWGYRWNLQIGGTTTGALTLNRFTARHFSLRLSSGGPWDQWAAMDADAFNDTFSVSNGWPYPLTPNVPAGFGFASNPIGYTIGSWRCDDVCTTDPWIFYKTLDASTNASIGGRTWMVPTNLPKYIVINGRSA